jgi:hypothetical protein
MVETVLPSAELASRGKLFAIRVLLRTEDVS